MMGESFWAECDYLQDFSFKRISVQITIAFLYIAQDVECQCEGEIKNISLSSSGRLYTLLYPVTLKYPPNQACAWRFSGTPGRAVELKFSHFDVEPGQDEHCDKDHVLLFDVDEAGFLKYGGRYCNGHPPPEIYTTVGESSGAEIRFSSNEVNEYTGFRVQAKVTGCNTNGETITEIPRMFSYPLYNLERYPPNRDCGWRILGPNYIDQVLSIEFNIFDVPETGDNGFFIYDGSSSNSALIGKYDKDHTPGTGVIQSTGRNMYLRLKAGVRNNGAQTGLGFGIRIFMSPYLPATSRPSSGLSTAGRVGVGFGTVVFLCCLCGVATTIIQKCKRTETATPATRTAGTRQTSSRTSHVNPNFTPDDLSPPSYDTYAMYPPPAVVVSPGQEGDVPPPPTDPPAPPPYQPKPEDPPPYSEVVQTQPEAPPPDYSQTTDTNTTHINTDNTTGPDNSTRTNSDQNDSGNMDTVVPDTSGQGDTSNTNNTRNV